MKTSSNCRICGNPLTRSQPSVECRTYRFLCHRDCTNPDYYTCPSVFSCCLQPEALVSNPSNPIVTTPPPIFTDTSTSPTLDSPQPTTTDCTLESITSTSITNSTPLPNPTTAPSVLPFPPLPSSSLLSTQPPTKRIHSSISSSPSPRIAKLPRIFPTSKPATTTSSSNKMPNADEPPEYFTKFADEMRKQNYEILQAIHTSTTRQQQEREEDRQSMHSNCITLARTYVRLSSTDFPLTPL